MDSIQPESEAPDGSAQGHPAAVEVTPPGSASSGEYVLVVVHGPAQVNAGALDGENIRPGDLLSTGSTTGGAGRAATVMVGGVETAVPGTVFAKALESPSETRDTIYVYVTLQ
jgi:hypothetical protein